MTVLQNFNKTNFEPRNFCHRNLFLIHFPQSWKRYKSERKPAQFCSPASYLFMCANEFCTVLRFMIDWGRFHLKFESENIAPTTDWNNLLLARFLLDESATYGSGFITIVGDS